jgi:hypothetical protein
MIEGNGNARADGGNSGVTFQLDEGALRQEELAVLIHGLTRQEDEERGHKEGTREAALELFPDLFDGERYRYDAQLSGRPYYVTVLEANRARLEQRDCYTRVSLYLTTTFGYEVMVVLLYEAVARAVAASPLPPEIRDRVVSVLRGILAEEETHLGVADQHAALEASAGAVA